MAPPDFDSQRIEVNRSTAGGPARYTARHDGTRHQAPERQLGCGVIPNALRDSHNSPRCPPAQANRSGTCAKGRVSVNEG